LQQRFYYPLAELKLGDGYSGQASSYLVQPKGYIAPPLLLFLIFLDIVS